MATYAILSRLAPEAATDPKELRKLAETVASEIKRQCPQVTWRQSFATLGRFDVLDIVESDDPHQLQRAAMIIRGYGHASTETLACTPWEEFIAAL
ncbi:MAG TPA: GYD domain-containing protein [Candidatus Acidoferrum sp.]|nr:GYD domain-containing protein [Candidatus Acidoferrum sp.]